MSQFLLWILLWLKEVEDIGSVAQTWSSVSSCSLSLRFGLLFVSHLTPPDHWESKKNVIFHSQVEAHSHRYHVLIASRRFGVTSQVAEREKDHSPSVKCSVYASALIPSLFNSLKSVRERERVGMGGRAALNAFTAAATASHQLKIPAASMTVGQIKLGSPFTKDRGGGWALRWITLLNRYPELNLAERKESPPAGAPCVVSHDDP